MPRAKSRASPPQAVRRARSPSPPPVRNVRPKLKHPQTAAVNEREDHPVGDRSRPLPPQVSRAEQQAVLGHAEAATTGRHDPPTKDTRLALAHLLYDKVEHPLYQENLDRVLDALSERADLTSALKLPFEALLASEEMQRYRDEEKKKEVTAMLTKLWLGKIFSHVGQMVGGTAEEYLQLEMEMPRHRLELKVSRIFHVDDLESVVEQQDEAADEHHGAEGDAESDTEYAGESEDESSYEGDDEDEIEDSGVDSAGDSNETSGNDTPTRLPGVTMSHYKRVTSQDTKLLLREPASASKGGKYLLIAVHDVVAAMRGVQGSSQHLRGGCNVTRYCKGHWCISLGSTLDAAYFAGLHVNIKAHRLQLAPFRPRRSQVFVCNHIPRKLNWSQALHDLCAVFPDRMLFAEKSLRPRDPTKKGTCLLAILDIPVDVETFKFTTQKRSGKYWSASFHAWNEGTTCHICGQDHRVWHCPMLASIPLGEAQPVNLLMDRPQVYANAGGP